MRQEFRDQICRAISTTLRRTLERNPQIEALDLAEAISDSVELVIDMNSGEDGIAPVPRGLLGGAEPVRESLDHDPNAREPWEVGRVTAPPNTPPVPTLALRQQPLPGRADRRIILPSDKDFNAPAAAGDPIKPATLIIRPTKARARVAPAKPKWDEADLIAALTEATPPSISFDTEDREGNTVRLKVDRNIHNQAGMGNVLITYTHPAINQTPADASTIVPQARVPFSIYDDGINIDEAMNGPNGVMVQLRGAYRARPEHMEPSSGPDPGPLRLDMKHQPGDSYESRLTPGLGQTADPYERNNAILLESKARNKRENDSLAPAGARIQR